MSTSLLTPPVSDRDHSAGPADAPVTLVEFGDLECPYCRLAEPIVAAARRELGSMLRFVYRHFPLAEMHPHARMAAQATEAAGAQGRFWEMRALLFEHQDALGENDLFGYAVALGLDTERFTRELSEQVHARRVSDDFRSGVRSGVNGTPTFFVNGERYDGPWTGATAFTRMLRDTAANRAGSRSSFAERQEVT